MNFYNGKVLYLCPIIHILLQGHSKEICSVPSASCCFYLNNYIFLERQQKIFSL